MDNQKFQLIMNRFDKIDNDLDSINVKLDTKIGTEECENARKNCVFIKKKSLD